MVLSDYTENMKDKLLRALKHKAVLSERSKLLRQQVEDFRTREASMNHIASELLQRQRELNYMLHRASSVLHQMQDTNLALSAEFTHLVKELPAPKENEGGTPEWEETMSRVNDLFHRTHELAGEMQDEIFRTTSGPVMPDAIIDTPQPTASATPEPQVEPPQPEIHVEAEPVEIQRAETPSAQRPEAPILDSERVGEVGAAPLLTKEGLGEVRGTDTPSAQRPVPLLQGDIEETEPEPEIVGVTIMQPESEAESADETPKVESADDLFRRLNSAASLNWPEDEQAAQSPRKPSLLARIFGKGDED